MSRQRPRIPRPVKVAVFSVIIVVCGYLIWLRYARVHFHVVVPGRVYRSAQPSANRLIQWSHTYSLRSVINLRGVDYPGFTDEAEAVRLVDVELISVPISSDRLPPRPKLMRLIEAIEKAPRPVLIHDREGISRSGLASALAAMAIGHTPYDRARRQLSWRYLRIWRDENDISGVLLEYERYCRENQMPAGVWQGFRRWAEEVYYPYYYGCVIDLPPKLVTTPKQQVIVRVSVTNRSARPLPADDPEKQFALIGFTTDTPPTSAEAILFSTELPDIHLMPNETATFDVRFTAPAETGEHPIRLDLLERDVTWFSAQGSPISNTLVVVEAAPR